MKNNRLMIRTGLAGAALLTLVAAAAQGAEYPTSVLAEGPVAYWRFNETTASPPIREVANLGTVGAAANGYLVLDAAMGEPGKIGSAVRLVNSGNVIGYCGSKVDVPFNAGINPRPPFSIEFWAKPNRLGVDATGSCPISSLEPQWYGGGNRSGWLFYMNNAGRWEFRLGTTSGYAGICTGTGGGNASIGAWQHIVGTYDGTTARLYANGVLIGSAAAPVANWTPNRQSALRIGGTPLQGGQADGPAISATGIAGNRGYDGWVDEVAIYPKVLTAEEIGAHFQAANNNPVAYADLVLSKAPAGYWNMDEDAVNAPDPASLPVAANDGSAGAAANATKWWGTRAAQPGPAFNGFGPNNNAVFFDSVSGVVAVEDAPALRISGNITMMAWVKPSVQDHFRNIVAQGWNADYAETFLRISRGGGSQGAGDGNYYEVGVTDGGSYYDVARFPIPSTDIGNWVFLAGTYDGGGWKLYRNGVLVDSTDAPGGALDVGTRWTIGGRAGPPSPTRFFSDGNFDTVWAVDGLFFGGWIDEVAVFNRALSESTISSLYAAAQITPIITKAPTAPAGQIFSGSSATFSVTAEGGTPLSYLWKLNGVSTGVTTPTYTASNLPEGNHTITVEVSNPYGSTSSSVSISAISAPPSIAQQPLPVTWYAGRPFSFSVAAGGSQPLIYQWKLNGTDIPGATGATYSGTASAGNAGNYTVKVMNAAGETLSEAAILTVIPITGDYLSAVIADDPLGYWRLGESAGSVAYDYYGGHHGTYYNVTLGQPGYSGLDTDTAVKFAGQNSRVGDISGTQINFTGNTNFTLEAWVNGPAGQPEQTSILVKGIGDDGTTATEQFALDISGGNYRFFVRRNANTIYDVIANVGPNGTWQHVVAVYDDTLQQMSLYVDGELQASDETSPGLNNTTTPFIIGSKRLGNDPNYNGTFNGTIDEVAVYSYALTAEQIQNHYGSAFGPNVAPQIRTQPQDATNYVTLPVSFSVSAFGSVPLTYQWKRNGQDIPGANSSQLTIDSLIAADAGDYTVTVVNSAGTVTSAPAKLTVLPAPTADVAIPALVVHLPFNGNLQDTTGRGNDGTGYRIVGAQTNTTASTYVTGKLGQALSYSSDMGSFGNPSPPNNSFVSLGVRPDLQFSSNVNFTVAFWIRLPVNYIGGDLPFFTTTVGSTFGTGLVLAPSYGAGATASDTGDHEGSWAYSIYDAAGNGVGVYGQIGLLNDGEWHHLVYSFDREVGSAVYVNGRLAAQERRGGTDVTAAGNIDTGLPATIGQDPTGTYGETGSADMDDFGVWRRALTPLEAASIYMAGMNGRTFVYVPPSEKPTLALGKDGDTWKLTFTGTLQASDRADGGYADLPGATSPYTLPTSTGAQQFYRARN